MIEFLAFTSTITQLVMFRLRSNREAWWMCLVCCALWAWVAVDRGMGFLFLQQLVFAVVALEALGFIKWKNDGAL